MNKPLPLINTDTADPKRPRRITNLEAALLAVLAMSYPQRVDAVDAFSTLRRIKYISAPDLLEGMVMLVTAMTRLEEFGYASSYRDEDVEWYALTPAGEKVTVGDPDIDAGLAMYAVMSHSGGKPC